MTPEQRKRIRDALAKNQPRALTTAEELHQFMLHYNWDGGVSAPRSVLVHPACDLGTALLTFWACEPSYAFGLYASHDDAVAADDVNIELLAFMEDVLARIEKGNFKSGAICFVPPDEKGKKRAFPRSVLTPSPGAPLPRQPIHDISLEPLGEKDKSALEKNLNAALKALRSMKLEIARDAPPAEIAAALQHLSERAPSETATLSKPARRALGFLFAEQLHRAHGADWLVRVANGKRELFVYTKDRAICLWASRVVDQALESDLKQFFSLDGVFAAFGKVVTCGEKYEELLSPEESRHLFRGPPGSWPVWGINWKLSPWPP